MSEREDFEAVRDGITVPSSHLANGMAITRHDEAHAALARIQARVEALERERDFMRDMAERRHEERNEARSRVEALEGALRFYAEQDDVNNYVAVAALAGETVP